MNDIEIYFNEVVHVRKIGQKSEIKPFNHSLQDFLNDVSNIKYEELYKEIKQFSEEIENDYNLPLFNKVFHELYFELGKIPVPVHYMETYIKKFFYNKNEYDKIYLKSNDKGYSLLGLKSRMLRAYPSLIRDVHMAILFMNTSDFRNIYYSTYLDGKGIDLSFFFKEKHYKCRFYANTKRSQKFLIKKNDYQNYDCNTIDFTIDFNNKKGDIFICDRQSYNELLNTINNYAKGNKNL